MSEVPYNPLDKANLARTVERELLHQPLLELPLAESFNGPGLYALYYFGGFSAYARLASLEVEIPIYVGKADPKGGRKGLVDPAAVARGTELYSRIRQHSASIEAASNLDIEDFRVRYLVVDDIFIGMTERLLIEHFRPLWNQHVDGFGNHDPGSGRRAGKRPAWDVLHPGRAWAASLAEGPSRESIEAEIREAVEDALRRHSDGSPPLET